MRTGDTPATERRAFVRTPPDILVTTPQSRFLLLSLRVEVPVADLATLREGTVDDRVRRPAGGGPRAPRVDVPRAGNTVNRREP
jgi:hypothetical protein